jgi:hypothetical protein
VGVRTQLGVAYLVWPEADAGTDYHTSSLFKRAVDLGTLMSVIERGVNEC